MNRRNLLILTSVLPLIACIKPEKEKPILVKIWKSNKRVRMKELKIGDVFTMELSDEKLQEYVAAGDPYIVDPIKDVWGILADPFNKKF